MMKTRITRISKRTLSMVLALLMILSVIGFGSIITVTARNGSTMYVCVSDATMASNDANEVWVNVKQNEQSNQNNWTSAEMESSNKFYNGKRIYKIVGVEDTTWGGLGALQIQLKKDGTWKAQKEPKANNGSWWSSSNYANKLYNYDSGSFVATYAEATHANGFTAGDYYIHNNVTGAWYGNGTDAPKMTKSGSIYYYDFYLKKNEVDTSNYLIFKFWDSSDSLQIGPDYESDHRCTLSTSDSWSSTVQSIQNYGDKDTAWQVNTSGFTTDKFNRVRITFDPTTLANSRNGRVKFTKTELADMDPTFSTTSFTKGTSYNLTSLVGVTSGSNAGTVSYSTYQYYDTSWHTISSPASWTPSATNITKLRVTATDGGVITTAGTTKNAVTARTETKETAITVSLATHTVSRSSAPSNGTLQLSSDNSTWGTSALTVAEGSNYYVKATPNTGYKINTLTVAGSTVSGASNSTSAYTHTGTMGTSNVSTSCTFSPQVYTITYKDQGNAAFSGTHASGYPTSHTYGTATTLKSASKTGYTFGGWFTSSDCSGTAVTSLGATAYTSNITLYAKWTLNSYTITLSENGASGGVLKVDDTVASTATHGSHTFRVDAPSGYEISSISGLGATWTNHESYAESNSVSITGAGTITVTYVASTKPALRIDYTGSGGTTFTATNGDSVTTSTRHNVTVTFTNQSSFANGTSYTVTQKIGSNAATTIKSGTTSTSGGNIVAKAAGTLSAGTYVYTISANNKTTSITVVVNQSRTLTVSSVSHTSVSGSYTNEFGQTSQSISAAGTFYCKSGTTYSVTYTADTYYCFSSSDNTQTTKSYSGTISAAVTTNPTVYEQKYSLTVKQKLGSAEATTVRTDTVKPVTKSTVAAPTPTGYTITGWTVTSGTVYVNGTAKAANSTISTAGDLSNITIRANATIQANFSDNSYILTVKQKKGSATATTLSTPTLYYHTNSTVTASAITGYKVTSWQVTSGTVYVDGTAKSSSSGVQSITAANTYSLSNVTIRAAATIQFNYTENTYTVTVTSSKQNNVALGNVSPSSVTAGVDTKPTITAEAKIGYEFVNWTGSNLTFTNANNASTTVAATAAGTATANFRRTRLYLDVSANSTWKNATYYKAYFFQSGNPYTTGTTNGFISMTAVDGVEDLYYVDLPGTFNTLSSNYGFIFIAKTDNNNDWNNKTAQTADLTFGGQKNKYIIGASSNSWADSPYFPPTAYAVTVSATTGGSVSGNSITAPDSGTPYPLPTPEAAYGYKFTGWKLVSGSVTYDNTTYSTANTIFSTTAASSILANQASSVQAVFDYDSNMNLYIVGRFRVYNTYSGSPRTATYVGGSSGAWSLTATNIPFQYDAANNYYYVETNSSIAELSATLSDKQYFRVYDQTNSKNWQLSANQALTESNESTQYTMVLSGDKSFYFNQTSNANGPVKICFNPVNNKLWFTIPARHTATVSTITTLPGTNIPSSYGGAGGTLTVNGGASATVSEGTGYTIAATPKAGYSVTSVKVNGTEVLPSVNVGSTAAVNISRAMGTSNETVTATFTAVQYNVTVGKNSSNSNNTVYVNTNGTQSVQLTVEDTLKPIVTAYAAGGYELDHIELRDSSDNVISGYDNVSNNTAGPMPAQAVKVYAVFKAIAPMIDKVNNTTITGNAYSATAYAGQSITFTPHSSTAGTVTYAKGGTNSSYVSVSGTTFTFTVPTNIGPDTTSTQEYSFTIIPTNTPETGMSEPGTAVTITVNASYSSIQKKYLNLYNTYNKYKGYSITAADTVLGNATGTPYKVYSTALSTAKSAVQSKIDDTNYMVAYNSSDTSPTYDTKRNNLEDAYTNLDFKTNTLYALTNYSAYVRIYSYATNRSGWFLDKNNGSNRINNTNTPSYTMTYEGVTNNGKYLYSFTYYGKSRFYVYSRNGVYSSSTKLSGAITGLSSAAYGSYYIDLKDNTASSSSSTSTYSPWSEFAVTDNYASLSSDLLEKSSHTFSEIKNLLGISYTGSLVGSGQDVSETFTVTGPTGRSDVTSTTTTLTSSQPWTPAESGRYRFVLNSNVGEDEDDTTGAVFSRSKTYYLFVAYDDVTIYADMNGNVGTPTIHFTYQDSNNNNEDTDLPLEFDMVSGSESVYSRIITLSELKDVYGLDLIGDGSLTIENVSIDGVEVTGSTFTITPAVARTGTLWLKADSTHMKTFNEIAYGSSRRTFKAVLREDGEDDVDYNNTFADVRGTGIITDELNGDSYEYNVFYAAKDTIADYNFSYNLRAKAQHDINNTVNNSTTHYYFDHWELSDGTTPSVANGTDININSAPDYGEGDVIYTAVYKPVSSSARCEITYKFRDFDTSDGNYEYDPTKTLKNETYVKTVKVDGAVNASNADSTAHTYAPLIESNYFDYDYDSATYVSYDSTTNKYKVEATFTETPHTYKIVVIDSSNTNHVVTGNYQQPLELKASDYGVTSGNYSWRLREGSTNTYKVLASFTSGNSSYIAPNQTSFIARFTSSNDLSGGVQTIRLYSSAATVSTASNIMYGYSTTYFDNSTEKAQHNFYIIDALTSSVGTLVGGGVVYATAEDGDWRQSAAETTLDTTAHIQSYINGILGTTYDQEYKAQTINNIGFRYLPYEKGQDVFRYSESMNSYIYTFAGTNTNSDSLDGQTLRVFSFFVYRNGNTYTTFVSNTYAECNRYIPAS